PEFHGLPSTIPTCDPRLKRFLKYKILFVVLNDTSYSELLPIVTPKAPEINRLTDEIFLSLSLAGS
ncbi:MAG: hypothetical protein ACO24L_08740, partial [Polynucleobacter sp.]